MCSLPNLVELCSLLEFWATLPLEEIRKGGPLDIIAVMLSLARRWFTIKDFDNLPMSIHYRMVDDSDLVACPRIYLPPAVGYFPTPTMGSLMIGCGFPFVPASPAPAGPVKPVPSEPIAATAEGSSVRALLPLV